MRRTFASTAIVAALVSGACNSGKDKGNEVARDFVAHICGLAFDCCTRGEIDVLLGPFVDADNCVDRLLNTAELQTALTISFALFDTPVAITLPNLNVLEQAIADGRVEIDQEAVNACFEFLGSVACAQPPEPPEEVEGCVPPPPPLETPCEEELMFVGKVGEGGRCTTPGSGFECKRGLVCRQFSVLGVQGVCVRPGGEGDVCASDAECQEELYCSLLDGTCQVPKQEGETCVFADPEDQAPSPSTLLVECAAGLFCDHVTDTCVAPCKRGATCLSDSQCDDTLGLFCIVGRCDEPRALGLPCGDDADCQEGLRCELDPLDPTREICTEKLALGEPCTPITGHTDCQSGFCDSIGECAAASPLGGLCPTAQHQQCDGGYCETEVVFCDEDGDCLGSGVCDTVAGVCEFYCVALRDEGAPCDETFQCVAEHACVAGFCRVLPLDDGDECTANAECKSGFCGFDSPRVCATLPLANGRACSAASQCESGVCFQSECHPGSPAGTPCGDFDDAPCNLETFCDPEKNPPTCTPVREAGEACEADFQCRGSCDVAFGRPVCDETPPPAGAVCDGI